MNCTDPRNAINAQEGLREQAEHRVKLREVQLDRMSTGEIRRLVYELQVHQMELDMQNEELRLTQTELAHSLERYNALFDLAPAGYLTLDAAGHIVEANLHASTMLGVMRESLAGCLFAQFVHPTCQDLLHRHLHSPVENSLPQTCELLLEPSAGNVLWVRMDSIRRDDPKQESGRVWLCSICDISESKRAYYERQKFVQLAEQSSDLIGLFDLELRPTYLNAAGLRLLGLDSLAHAQQFAPSDFLFPEDRDAILQEFIPGIARSGRGEMEIRFHHLAGREEKWLDCKVFTIAGNSGQSSILAAVCRDISASKRQELAMRVSAQLYRKTLEAVPAQIAMVDREGHVMATNKRWRDFRAKRSATKRSADHVDWTYLTASAKAEPGFREAHAAIRAVLEGAQEFSELEYFRDGSDDPAWLHLTVMPLETESAGGAVISLIDVTKRRSAEEKLKERELFFRQTLESIPGMVFIFHADGACDYLSQQWTDFTGMLLAEVAGCGWKKALHPDDQPRVEAAWVLALERRESYELEHRIRHRNGAYQWFRVICRPIFDKDLQIDRWFGVALNVDELKRAEDKLRISEERFRHVFEHAVTGIAIASVGGQFVLCNPAYCALTGYSDSELRAMTFQDLIHPEDRAANLAQAARLTAGGISHFEIENRYVAKGGREVWVQKFVSLMQGETGSNPHFLELAADVTERRDMLKALQQSDRRKDEFLATLAHELRNPLAALVHANEIVGSPNADKAVVEHCQELIKRQLNQLTHLVDDLLEVSRISQGKIVMVKAPIPLAEVIGNAIEALQPQIHASGKQFQVSLPPPSVMVNADRLRLTQVFSNLLHNSNKFTVAGGNISLEVLPESDGVIVVVRDDGIGIASDQLPRIFDMFTQARHDGPCHQGGLGIGLSLARSLVEMHNGTISAHSAGPGKGSEFRVHLPLMHLRQNAPKANGRAKSVCLDHYRVLVVDDNHDAADSFAVALKLRGATTLAVYGGADALRVIPSFRPSIAFIDLGMPDMDGFETARRIRQNPEYRHIRLVALSGWSQESDRDKSRDAGFDCHLAKPLAIDDVADVLNPG